VAPAIFFVIKLPRGKSSLEFSADNLQFARDIVSSDKITEKGTEKSTFLSFVCTNIIANAFISSENKLV